MADKEKVRDELITTLNGALKDVIGYVPLDSVIRIADILIENGVIAPSEKEQTINNYTDEQIIKALEHCVSSTTNEACDGCPLNIDKEGCETYSYLLESLALDLINRQKADIERLSTSLGEWKISALKKADRVDELEREKSHLIYSSMIGTTRAEAITEFEERCAKRFPSFVGVFHKIAKELKEGVNNA